MGTRSTIAVVHQDNTVSQIYCHWDGYLEHNGMLLEQFYNSREAVEKLVALGDLSSLNETIGEKHPFSYFGVMESDEYDRLYGKMCTFYGRDRGETGVDARKYGSLVEYFAECQKEEFDYVFSDGEWFVRHHDTAGEWKQMRATCTSAV